MDSEKIKILFAQTHLGDYESEEAWAAVSALRMDGSREIFDYAVGYSFSECGNSRQPDSFISTPNFEAACLMRFHASSRSESVTPST